MVGVCKFESILCAVIGDVVNEDNLEIIGAAFHEVEFEHGPSGFISWHLSLEIVEILLFIARFDSGSYKFTSCIFSFWDSHDDPFAFAGHNFFDFVDACLFYLKTSLALDHPSSTSLNFIFIITTKALKAI